MQLQIQGREIALDGIHPGSMWPPRWTSPARGRRLKITWLVSAFSYILTRCPKKERRRDLTMDASGGWLVMWRTSAFLTKSCQQMLKILHRHHYLFLMYYNTTYSSSALGVTHVVQKIHKTMPRFFWRLCSHHRQLQKKLPQYQQATLG